MDFALDSLIAIGDSSGSSPYVFGRVEAAALLPHGRVVVLDSRILDLRTFDQEGVQLTRAGREGTGPGEFKDPKDLEVAGSGEVWGLDPNRPGISRWSVGEADLKEVGSIPLPIFGESMCLLDGRLFVHALHEERVVHELSEEGRILRSLGRAYMPENPVERRGRYSWIVGYIACVPESNHIVHVALNRPEVVAFTPEGRRAWEYEIEGFHRLIAVETERGTTAYMGEGETGWTHQVASLVTLPGGRVAIQVVQRGLRCGPILGEIAGQPRDRTSSSNGTHAASLRAAARGIGAWAWPRERGPAGHAAWDWGRRAGLERCWRPEWSRGMLRAARREFWYVVRRSTPGGVR